MIADTRLGTDAEFVEMHDERIAYRAQGRGEVVVLLRAAWDPTRGGILRLLSAPGAEFVLPVLAPKVVLVMGNRVLSWLSGTRLGSPQAQQMWQAYSRSPIRPPGRRFCTLCGRWSTIADSPSVH
jgi:hypothetical protein